MTDRIEAAIQEGRDAKYLLEDPTFQKVIGGLKADIVTQWRATATGSVSLREALWSEMHALDAIQSTLTIRVERAEQEAKKLERANDPAPKMRVVP